jgi:hypothetical protein
MVDVVGPRPALGAGPWLFGLALGVYLLTAGGSLTTSDAVTAFDVTQNMVQTGTVALSGNLLGMDSIRGRDGRYYSPFGIAQSVFNVPFYLAGRSFMRITGIELGKPDSIPKAVVALAQTLVVAIVIWQIFSLSMVVTRDATASVMASLTAAFGTVLWPFARFGFNQPLACAALTGTVLLAVKGVRHRRSVDLGLAGWCLAAGILTRHELLLAAPVVGAWLYLSARSREEGARGLLAFGPGVVAGIVGWMAFNAVRFGNPFDSGYLRDPVPGFGSPLLEGLAGLLFSPGASVLLYSPVAIVGVAGLVRLWRDDRSTGILFSTMAAAFLLLYGSLGNWIGGRSYGSRYLLIILPLLMIGWASLLARVGRRARRRLFVVVTGAGILVQLPGVAVDYAKVSRAHAEVGPTSTEARQWAWQASPLVLNARAAIAAVPDNVAYVTGRRPRPEVRPPDHALDRSFSQQFAFSLDFWWLYLFYLGVFSRAALATTVAGMVAWILFCGRRLMRSLDPQP